MEWLDSWILILGVGGVSGVIGQMTFGICIAVSSSRDNTYPFYLRRLFDDHTIDMKNSKIELHSAKPLKLA
ncbi:hypothetical protein BJ878DRAFT_283844 [Calycina marina]|uniref:Uncharacterized protein n=1 Tax=Calycina marina TaxID=1763456 RepID=A0A9P8CIG4_9HELO|nr:hypothetical protein BJ878DRAFT_283844 [Calycina marina]